MEFEEEFDRLSEKIDEFIDERLDSENRLQRDIADLELPVHVERILDRIETLRMRENVDELAAIADYDALALAGGYFLGHTKTSPNTLFGKDAPDDFVARTYTELEHDLRQLCNKGETDTARNITTSVLAIITTEMVWTMAIWWALAGRPKMVKSTFTLFAAPQAFGRKVKKHALKVSRYFGDATNVGAGGKKNPAIAAMTRVVDLLEARKRLQAAFLAPEQPAA